MARARRALTMTRNEFTLLYAIRKHGMQGHRKIRDNTALSTGYISQTLNVFQERGWVNREGITEKGMEALLPFKVDNAVIMAAGMSTRFVPISLEKPKGLLVVKNEVLIERQIEQLQEAGIHEIVLVLGYKKEAFFYLEDKYEGLRIIINPEYNTKNNTHTLYLAQSWIKNTYICSSDDYFEVNPFEAYVYQSYYAAVHVHEKTSEWYMIPDAKGCIAKVQESGEDGLLDGLMQAYPESDRLEWNFDNDNFDVLKRSDILISDFSGVIFDFALVFEKPIIYADVSFDDAPYDAGWLDERLWTFTILDKLGMRLTAENVGDIGDMIDHCLRAPEYREGRERARRETWANMGHSIERIADYLIEKNGELQKAKAEADRPAAREAARAR